MNTLTKTCLDILLCSATALALVACSVLIVLLILSAKTLIDDWRKSQ